MSASTISHWETGKAEPNRRNIEALCSVFGVSYDELVPRRTTKAGVGDPAIDEQLRDLAQRLGLSEEHLRKAVKDAASAGKTGSAGARSEPPAFELPTERAGVTGIRGRLTPMRKHRVK